MILSFKTKINGKPTYFVEKIHSGLLQNDIVDFEGISFENRDFDVNQFAESEPKIHTIRKDEKGRWKAGIMIDFFINARQKDMFRFAPRIAVASTQEIFMTRRGQTLEMTIANVDSYLGGDDKYMYYDEQCKLAINDGFSCYQDFFNYFSEEIKKNGKETGNYWFKGKIIHWTDFKY